MSSLSSSQVPSLQHGLDKRIMTRGLSSNKLPPHKHIIPPMPPPPPSPITRPRLSKIRIIEPPIRSRPFRPFRGARVPPHVKRKQQSSRRNGVTGTTNASSTRPFEFATFPVQAIHAARSINLAAVNSRVFATKSVKRMMERLSVVVQLPPPATIMAENGGSTSTFYHEEKQLPRFVAVFRFGSVVFFNVAPRDVADLLWKIKQCSKDPFLSGHEQREIFCVHVQPEIPEDGKIVTGEYCIVQELNMKSVDVISNVLAQSVALDSYNDTVDDLLANFEVINHKVTGGAAGNLTTADRDNMFRAVARNNSIFIEMVSKVGIKDRIDTAWNLSQYEDIHVGMKEEFDINQRFEHIEFKLNLIQQNAKFFLEVLAHQKSNSLEWIIIVLIMFECVLMCMEMSGVGEVVFGTIGSLILPPSS